MGLDASSQDFAIRAVEIVAALAMAFIVINSAFFTVEQQSVAIIERFGKYQRAVGAGLQMKVPIIDSLAKIVSLRVQQLKVAVDTKTRDNVFVRLDVAVQYRVISGREADSYYKLADEKAQILAYVLDVGRAKVPTMTLDEAFEKKDEVGQAVRDELRAAMHDYGFEIVTALVVDIDPDQKVKAAMNEIQAQTRLQEAAKARGEGDKILAVKKAEAEAESKRLQGEGVANQRRAIVDGLRDSINALKQAAPDVNVSEVMQLVLMTQYFDAIRDVGTTSGTKVLLMPHQPGGLSTIAEQLRNAIITGEESV